MLSRAPVDTGNVDSVMMIETRKDELLMFLRADLGLKKIIHVLRKDVNKRSKREKGLADGFKLFDGMLYKVEAKDGKLYERYFVPKAMRKSLTIQFHQLNSHFGLDKTVKRMSEHFYSPRMKQYVKVHIRNCFECILTKHKTVF